jgi:hypothetical protein
VLVQDVEALGVINQHVDVNGLTNPLLLDWFGVLTMSAFSSPLLSHLPVGVLATLLVKARVVSAQLAVWTFVPIVWLLAFTHPMPGFLTELASVVHPLDGALFCCWLGAVSLNPIVASSAQPFNPLNGNHAGSAQQREIVLIGVLNHSWQPGPVKPFPELPFAHKLEECILHARPQPGLLHPSLRCFKVDDHLPGLVVKTFMEFVHCTGEFLQVLCKLRIHWDAGTD